MSLFYKKKNIERTIDISSKEGFEWLYNRYWEKVFAVCYHSTEDMELAREMTQDIFKSIWERKNSLEIEKSYEHYLVRSAKLKVAEYFRNQSIRREHFKQATQDFTDSANCTEQDVAYSMLAKELDLLVDQLSYQCRNVFKMSRGQGMTNREIAKKLQTTERAVEYHISKALAFLKKELPEYNLS